MTIVKFVYETLNNAERFTKIICAKDVSVKTVSAVLISTWFHISNVNASSAHSLVKALRASLFYQLGT